ncbi:hypothetical protein B0I08_107198 [Glaciihabitans tibetensis]|uniref:Uncharacterized protein n=1 Tax=Glaciihabitans tibetensis TaxID=1266600 RepID=A0A2T0VAT7_9MICO|nr:hypothetical protein [Glaciihabitans tibetensis]PRY67302.1 hypothetical protein B0I08_107198 [Glaciihabitans tibetensis]
MRTPLVIVTAVLSSLLLASCTPTPDDGNASESLPSATASFSATPSPSMAASSSATPSPAETAQAPASIIIGLAATDVVDASGTVLVSLDYTSDGDQAVALVTDLLGAPTSTENLPENPHYFETDITRWGGFEIGVRRPSDESAPKTQFYVEATADETSGVAIAAVDGTQVGDSFDEALVGLPSFQTYSDPNYPPRALALQVEEGDSEESIAYGLIAVESADGGAIALIKSPDYVYDAA